MKLFELLDVIDKQQEICVANENKRKGVKLLYKGLAKDTPEELEHKEIENVWSVEMFPVIHIIVED